MSPHPSISFPHAWALQICTSQCSHKALEFMHQRPPLRCSGCPGPHPSSRLGEPRLALWDFPRALCSASAHAVPLTGERIACFGVAPESHLWGSKIQFETPLNMHFQGQDHKPHWCKCHLNRRINKWHFSCCFGKHVPPDLRNCCLFCT